MALAGYKFKWEAEAPEQTTRHGRTWTRMSDNSLLAAVVRDVLCKVFDVSRIKVWIPVDSNGGVVGVSMADACFDELESLAEVVGEKLPAYTVHTWHEDVATKEKAVAVTWNDARPETRAMYVLVTDDPHSHKNGVHKVSGNGRLAYSVNPAPHRTPGQTDIVVESVAAIDRAWGLFLSGKIKPVANLANYNPPTGFVLSREFGLGEVVCVNGSGPYEVTIDTHRGERKTFTWDPTHDRKATPRESATMAYRVALTMRQKWMTDGFGRPTAAYVEACGVVAATWVEYAAREALTVSDLLTHVRLRMSLT